MSVAYLNCRVSCQSLWSRRYGQSMKLSVEAQIRLYGLTISWILWLWLLFWHLWHRSLGIKLNFVVYCILLIASFVCLSFSLANGSFFFFPRFLLWGNPWQNHSMKTFYFRDVKFSICCQTRGFTGMFCSISIILLSPFIFRLEF